MKKIRIILILLFLLLLSFPAQSQYYSMGTEPYNVKWNKIKSKHYTFIYPRPIDSLARVYINLMENNRADILKPLNINPKRIPVILHPFSTYSNGSVSWAPKQVNLITTPEAYTGSADIWAKNLALHETRHIGQLSYFTKGVYKFLYPFIGQQSTGIGIVYPGRFNLEGGAVISETELSLAGRGRSASFTMYNRAAAIQGDMRNWNKWLLGSFKHYTPNVYAFGYLINAAARMETNDVSYIGPYLDYEVRHFYNPFFKVNQCKKFFGFSRLKLFKKYNYEFALQWRQDYDNRKPYTDYTPLISKLPNIYTNYTNLRPISDSSSRYYGSIVATKAGYHNARELIRIDTIGKEHLIRPFNSTCSALVVQGDKVYWTEPVSRGSRSLQNFSELYSYSIASHKLKRLSRRTKYFNPALSQDGHYIAVTEYPITGSSFLVLLDNDVENAGSRNKDIKKILARIEAPFKGQIRESAFINDTIYCTVITDKGLGIYKIGMEKDSKWICEVEEQHQSIQHLRAVSDTINGERRDRLYFSSDLDGVINIYAYDLSSKSLTHLTNSQFGTSNPYYDSVSNNLYFSEFTLNGYIPVFNSLENIKEDRKNRVLKSDDFNKPFKYPIAEKLTEQRKQFDEDSPSEEITPINAFDTIAFPHKKYSKLTHFFNIHSWAPLYYDPNEVASIISKEDIMSEVHPGVTLISQNNLGTATSFFGLDYHDGYLAKHVNITYSGWAPIISISADINDRKRYSFSETIPYGSVSDNYTKISSYRPMNLLWTDDPFIDFTILTYYPIDLSSHGWNRGIIPQASWEWQNDQYYSINRKQFIFNNKLDFALTYYQMLATAHSNLYPRWGFGAKALVSTAPLTGEYFGNMMYLKAYGYLPGVVRGQGLKLSFSYQKQFLDGNKYYLPSEADLPRGYINQTPTSEFTKITADYSIPIYLSDISLGPLFYLRRLQILPFVDYAYDRAPSVSTNYYSMGSSFLLDLNILRIQQFPLLLGPQIAWTGPQSGSRLYVGFKFNVNL